MNSSNEDDDSPRRSLTAAQNNSLPLNCLAILLAGLITHQFAHGTLALHLLETC